MNPEPLSLPRWFSYLALLIAIVMIPYSLVQPLIPIFSWLFPVFMMLFVRSNKKGRGLLIGWISMILSFVILALPSADAFGGILIGLVVAIILGTFTFLPFVIDRLVHYKLTNILSTLVFPLAWVTVEFLRSFSPYIASAGVLGVTQYDFLLIAQIASVAGIWAIAFLMTWLAPVVCLAWENRFELTKVRRSVLLYLVILVLVLGLGGIRLGFDRPDSPSVRVAGILSFTPTEESLEASRALLNTYVPIAADAGAKIVMTYEIALFIDSKDEAELIEIGQSLAKQENVYLLLGIEVIDRDRSLPYENKTIFISPEGELLWKYTKHRLTPPEAVKFIPGQGPIPVVETPYGNISSVICYDAEFPNFVRQGVSQGGADILLIPAWDYIGVEQVWSSYVAFRAIENGVSMFRLTRDGLTLAVDYLGRSLVQSSYFLNDQPIIYADLPTEGKDTVYGLLGDWIAWLSVIGLALLMVISIKDQKSEKEMRISDNMTDD